MWSQLWFRDQWTARNHCSGPESATNENRYICSTKSTFCPWIFSMRSCTRSSSMCDCCFSNNIYIRWTMVIFSLQTFIYDLEADSNLIKQSFFIVILNLNRLLTATLHCITVIHVHLSDNRAVALPDTVYEQFETHVN